MSHLGTGGEKKIGQAVNGLTERHGERKRQGGLGIMESFNDICKQIERGTEHFLNGLRCPLGHGEDE